MAILLVGCATASRAERSEQLLREHAEISEKLQLAVTLGARTRDCAPKESAIAAANLEFAAKATAALEFVRAREHLDVARRWTELATEKTTPGCVPPGMIYEMVRDPIDRDGDRYDDDTDSCPNDPEDFDGFEDDDGCPEPDPE
jgi:OOP family OmpA-OmpF porin